MIGVRGHNLADAYHTALQGLLDHGEIVPCPDYNTRQKETQLVMHVTNAMAEPMISKCTKCGPRELQQYKMEICDGILDFMIGKGENMWEYTYHDRYAKYLPFVIEELKRNPYSRRAIINIRDNDIDSANSHPACLQSLQFMIRNNKLNLIAMMRSNDAPEATFMNAFAFIMLQEKIAKELNIEVGEYIHIANSFHAYEKDWELLYNYCNRIMTDPKNLTYNYKGGWQELMESYSSDIMESTVKPLKEKYRVTE